MGNYDLNDDDVLYLEEQAPFLGEARTLKVGQMKDNLKKQFYELTKIRLRLEIELEPEPEPKPINDDPNFLDSLRTELYPKQ